MFQMSILDINLKMTNLRLQTHLLWADKLTHWGRVMHICVGNLTIIGSDDGLLPGRRQAIIWTNAVILLIGLLGTNFSELLIEIQTFSFKKKHLKVSSAKLRPFCLGLNELMSCPPYHNGQSKYSASKNMHAVVFLCYLVLVKLSHVLQGSLTGTGTEQPHDWVCVCDTTPKMDKWMR